MIVPTFRKNLQIPDPNFFQKMNHGFLYEFTLKYKFVVVLAD
ncbi:hypothetical protein LEP1GSC150_5414 [Leptospira interrogans serovar Copenhageni str. LT2050]|uniref:Uncharacterized protein n=1 Tax=Leptospira interrogans serovar Copenhageni str. LT2050 TaxID=1001598 RepID=M3GA86_LEPIT|nr:hypothetical protein LEP1GSC150_5414 [Leptospira interrogans serovar Copenhageni str. LT2050]